VITFSGSSKKEIIELAKDLVRAMKRDGMEWRAVEVRVEEEEEEEEEEGGGKGDDARSGVNTRLDGCKRKAGDVRLLVERCACDEVDVGNTKRRKECTVDAKATTSTSNSSDDRITAPAKDGGKGKMRVRERERVALERHADFLHELKTIERLSTLMLMMLRGAFVEQGSELAREFGRTRRGQTSSALRRPIGRGGMRDL
jgi:hypothetical protein